MSKGTPSPKYPPGPLGMTEISDAIRALPERITSEDVGTVATLASLLGVWDRVEPERKRDEE